MMAMVEAPEATCPRCQQKCVADSYDVVDDIAINEVFTCSNHGVWRFVWDHRKNEVHVVFAADYTHCSHFPERNQ